MTAKTVVLNVAFAEGSIAIDYARTSDVRDNAGVGSPVVVTHRIELEKGNRQYRDEIDEIQDKILDLIEDVMEDFEVADPVDFPERGD